MEKTIFKEGQEVMLHVKGAGVVSTEPTKILKIENGVIHTDTRDFDLSGKWIGEDKLFGFDFWIEQKED